VSEAESVKRGRRDGFSPASTLLVHDIKNLSFRLGLLLRNVQDHFEDPLFRQSVVDVLRETVDKMDRMVRRCRDYGEGVMIRYPVDLNEVLDGIIEALPEHGRRGAGLLVEARYGRIPKIWGDPEILGEAFAILIQNGLEAMPDDAGRLRIETGSRAAGNGRGRVVVTISDTGCGMSPEFVKTKLFTPFVTTKRHGLGLGLYACRRIIQLHDGAIRVRSRPGRGTAFSVSFRPA
jgi:signal transduction histidine kinase